MKAFDSNSVRYGKRVLESSEGFTLIEVMIAVVVFSIGVLAVAQLEIHAARNTTRGNVITQANMLASARLEQLKNLSDLADMDPFDGAVETDIDRFGMPGGVFTRTTTVSNAPVPIGAMARQITVTVTWKSGWAVGHRQVQMSTLTQGNGI